MENTEKIELVDMDSDWQNDFNLKLFEDLKLTNRIKVYGCLIRMFEKGDGSCFVLLFTPINRLMDLHLFLPGEARDIEDVTRDFMPVILEYTGMSYLVMHLFADGYIHSNPTEDRCIREAVHTITTAMKKLGGYFHLDSTQERDDIFKNVYEAVRDHTKIKASEEMKFKSGYTLEFYKEIEALVNSVAKEE